MDSIEGDQADRTLILAKRPARGVDRRHHLKIPTLKPQRLECGKDPASAIEHHSPSWALQPLQIARIHRGVSALAGAS
ncbi:hypothetical protein [Thauera humireducens]|uniref:hypothetical protein n=1 Tax=Thauera humireducens TaxID=1134435 RepID=UPI00311F701C